MDMPASVQKFNLSAAGDFYSHRLQSYSTGDMQFNIAVEELVRKNPGKVNKFYIRINREDNKDTFQRDLLSSFSILGSYRLISDNETFHVFGSNWAIEIGGEKKYDDETGEDVIDSSIISLITSKGKLLEKLKAKLLEKGFSLTDDKKKDGAIQVTFAFPGDRGPDLHLREFDALSFNSIKQNYTPEISTQVGNLIQAIKGTTHGLVLLGGPVGTGKSYLIRALLSEITSRHPIVCSPAGLFLERAGLLNQVLAQFKKSIVVLEDIGSVLEVDAALAITDQRANLLNITEGLLSLLFDSIVIISFNHDPEKIDEAVRRPGRCLAYFKVGMLPHSQAQELVGKNLLLPKREYSLAEIYEMKRTGTTVPGKLTLGLNR